MAPAIKHPTPVRADTHVSLIFKSCFVRYKISSSLWTCRKSTCFLFTVKPTLVHPGPTYGSAYSFNFTCEKNEGCSNLVRNSGNWVTVSWNWLIITFLSQHILKLYISWTGHWHSAGIQLHVHLYPACIKQPFMSKVDRPARRYPLWRQKIGYIVYLLHFYTKPTWEELIQGYRSLV